MQNQTSPLILSFGAADPVGATGVQADLATFAALSCHGLSVPTATLIGDTARVEEVQPVEPDWLADQARVLLEDMPIAAIKVGALGGVEQIGAIAEIVSDYPDAPLILDPFASALPQQGLDGDEMLLAMRQLLIPQTTLLMLSPAELERLAESWREPAGADTLREDIDHLLALGCEFVLLTGTPDDARGDGARRANTLYGHDGLLHHDGWRHQSGAFLGAGGTLSAAIAALMACNGGDAPAAVQAAQHYTAGALAHAQRFGMGKLVPNRFYRFLAASAPAADTGRSTLDD